MNRIAWVSVLAVVTLGGCGGTTPEQQVINDAAAALGGRERIEAVRTLVVTGEGTAYAVGSDQLIDTNYRIYTLTGYKHAIDIPGARALVEQTRTPTTPNFSGQAPARQVQGIDGEVAYNVAANGNRTRAANEVTVRARRANMYHHPLTIVRAALDPAATVANARMDGNETLVDVTTGGVTLTLGVDGTTKLPTRVVSKTAGENILGDVSIETAFADYQDMAGLKLPARLTRKTDTFKDFEIRVTHSVDGETGDLVAPASVVSAPAAQPPEERSIVNAEEVAKGIWHLTGTTHHSVLVEFSDHLTLIEAPNEDRALGIFAKAKELRPDKPLTTLINTHHHLDHSAGVRAAVSEGLTIITHRSNAAFYEAAVKRPHTILPDVLAEKANPPPLKLITVDEEMTLKDDVMTLVMYRIANNTHADNNLMIYFPRERILVQADIFMPRDPRTQGHAPWVKNLADNIEMRKLNVARHVPLHGRIVPHSEFLQVVKDGYDRTVAKEPPPNRYSPT